MTEISKISASLVQQHTLKNAIHCSGLAVYSGRKISMTLRPAPSDSGVIFRRNDLGEGAWVTANWQQAEATAEGTVLLGDDGVQVARIEHLLSALAGCGIDNVIVDLDGPEVPAMDGSAAPFVFLLECAGTTAQKLPRQALRVRRAVEQSAPVGALSLAPAGSLAIDAEIATGFAALGRQRFRFTADASTYKREISRARTFRRRDEREANGSDEAVALGSPKHGVVIEGDEILNEGGLRYHNEPVRHLVLDLIGDLYLAGGPVLGEIKVKDGGHALTLDLLRSLFADAKAWTWTTLSETVAAERPEETPRRSAAGGA